MSKNSPITQRIQKALYMRSAAKQTENNEEDKTTFVDDPRTGTVKKGKFVETLVPGASVDEGLEGSYTGNKLYEGDYYAPDSPLGREMKKLGLENITADSIRDYEKSKLIKNRKSGNTEQFGGVKATNEAGETRDVSDDELQNISDEDIMSRNVQTQGPDEIVETFEAEDVPQDFEVQSQYQAGKNARGNRKKINTTMRNERKLGAFKGDKPQDQGYSSSKRWTKADKKLYAARLLSGTGETGGVGVGGQNYESNKMVFQKNTGDTENQTYTNINDSKYRTNEEINPETGDLEQKNIAMYEPKSTSASKMLGATPLKSRFTKIMKSVDKGRNLTKKTDLLPAEIPKVKPKAKPEKTIDIDYEDVTDVGKGTKNVSKGDLPGKGGLGTKIKNAVKAITPGRKTVVGLAGLGAGYYMGTRGGDDVKPNVTTGGGGNGGGNTGGGDNNNTTTTTTPPKRTTGTTKVNGVRRDLPVAKPSSNPVSVSDSLSTSSNRAAERQANRDARFDARQGRRQQRLDNRQARRAQRRANPTLVGGALRRTFGGKKMDTNINNMGNYNQNDKKKNGQFGGTSRPGYNA